MGGNKRDIMGDAGRMLGLEDGGSYTPSEIMKITAITEAIKHLQNFKNPFAVTQLSAREVMLFSQAQEIAKAWDWDINPLLVDLAVKKMSEGRKSREEIKDTLIGIAKGDKKKDKGFYQNPQSAGGGGGGE